MLPRTLIHPEQNFSSFQRTRLDLDTPEKCFMPGQASFFPSLLSAHLDWQATGRPASAIALTTTVSAERHAVGVREDRKAPVPTLSWYCAIVFLGVPLAVSSWRQGIPLDERKQERMG